MITLSSDTGRGHRRRLNLRRRHGDCGSVSLEMVILTPALLLIISILLQGAMYYHARTVAMAAAQQGVRTARADQSSPGAGERAAREFLAQVDADKVIDGARVSSSRTARQVTITVSGRSLGVIPFLPPMTVTQSATGTREVWSTG